MATFVLGLLLLAEPTPAVAQPALVLDLAEVESESGFFRAYGSVGNGSTGVPVAGGGDVDDDGHPDSAFSAMRATYSGRAQSGIVFLVFGDGSISGSVNSAVVQERVLQIAGAIRQEHAGSELWMDDVTGDGIADLLICRQDYTPDHQASEPARQGAGALTILVGGPEVGTFADTLMTVDLLSPPEELTLTTILGDEFEDRLGIWARTADVDGDNVKDILVAADRQTLYGGALDDNGALYVIRGGAHLASGSEWDLADFGQPGFGLDGNIARIDPPSPASDYHFGSTVQLGDLDGNGKAEVMAAAAALNRAGAALQPFGASGDGNSSQAGSNGMVFIVWDDNFPAAPWPAGFSFVANAGSGSSSRIEHGAMNDKFGEEMLGGLDYDNDGTPDLFIGDITGDGPNGNNSGLGNLLFNAPLWKGFDGSVSSPPAGALVVDIYGPSPGAIGADTALHGDFDGDGIDDLAFSSPHGDPDPPFEQPRFQAGIVHVVYGYEGDWPTTLDLANPPNEDVLPIAEIWGAQPGDVLCYSAADGDMDGDGRTDLIINEMTGDGLSPGTDNVGNLVIVSGRLLNRFLLFENGFESGDTSGWTSVTP